MKAFWQIKTLDEMTREEWESLCDGCGKCCTIRLEDIDTGKILSTNVVCKYFEQSSCQCQCYQQRSKLVPDCLTLTPDVLKDLNWLPSTCAYRLLKNGESLPDWHPLVTGDKQSTITSGNSIQSKVVSEYDIHPDDLENFILDWNW